MNLSKLTFQLLAVFCLSFVYNTIAQIGINSDNSAPAASAMLDVKSIDKGVLFPRIASDIASPTEGLFYYNTTSKGFRFYNGTSWQNAFGSGGAGSQWATNGTAINYPTGNVGIGISNPNTKLHLKGTGAGNQILLEDNGGTMLRFSNEGGSPGPYIGTTSNHRLSFATNNALRAQFEANGNFGIGVATAQKTLSVGGAVVVDQNNFNSGNSSYILSFGSFSGEGIGSNRNTANNQFGLDFYTANSRRLSIKNNGNIGIGTFDPQSIFEVNVGDDRSIRFTNDLVPSIEIASQYESTDGLAGIMRFRNAIEIMPSTNGARAGKLDVRNTSGAATIVLNGANGEVSANKIVASNLPAFGMKEGVPFLNIAGNSTQNAVLLEANVNFPSTGNAHITAHCLGVRFDRNTHPSTPSPTTLEFKLDLYDANNNYISTLKKQELRYNLDYEIPVLDVNYTVATPGNYILKYVLYKTNYGPQGFLETSKIMVSFYPNALSVN